ncbi:L,D-transpeptidase [Pseudochrobactrum sp. MP213Fo]|uniref:L,D-transpeptidase n=1 Tax=Pseudochrobactrum sp. MP213Fo TaxID=3022250 RepID=UPI003B9FA41D
MLGLSATVLTSLTYGTVSAAPSGASKADAAGERPVLMAQLYDPGEEIYQDDKVRVYIDPSGRQVTMDRHGKILRIQDQPSGYQQRPAPQPQYVAPNTNDNWTLNGPVDGGAPYDGFANVPDDAGVDYYPAAPSSGRGAVNNAAVERSNLPNVGGSANYDNNEFQPAIEDPYGQAPGGTSLPSPSQQTPAVIMPKGQGAKTKIASYQILLDRAGTSPGVVDGKAGSNVDKATAAYFEVTGISVNPADEMQVNAQLEATGGPAFTEYTISNEDIGRFYLASVPNDYSEKAKLQEMAYVSPREMLAERFHIDETYLQEINPGISFRQPGEVIRVPNLGKQKRPKVARIIADKARKQVRGYDESGKLVVAYPSTIGSADNPSPSGIVTVERIAINPNYTYNPKINFKQGNNDKVLTIPPGPNGPVGTVWIALSKPTYGIHGTPDPSRIGKTSSHGCIRLANWDAEELAKLVKAGVTVEFTE